LLFSAPLLFAARGTWRWSEWSHLADVAVLLAGVWLLGLPVATALFSAFFLRWRFAVPWWQGALAGITVALFQWGLFERWLEIPLGLGRLGTLL
ncbi:MAG TPA: hypothetical protein VJL84_11130, partial [Kiloniellales bacterium]|nr:hypothetical protein [Kiloniellales bacterium]